MTHTSLSCTVGYHLHARGGCELLLDLALLSMAKTLAVQGQGALLAPAALAVPKHWM